MASLIATAASVPTSAVTLTVTAASIIITAKVVTTAAAQSGVVSSLDANLGTVGKATSFFTSVSGGGVPVVSAPTVKALTESVVGDAPPSLPPFGGGDAGSGLGSGALVGIAVSSVAAGVLLLSAILYVLNIQKAKPFSNDYKVPSHMDHYKSSAIPHPMMNVENV